MPRDRRPEPLTERQTVPMSAPDRQRLRKASADHGVGPGVLARALILDGLRRLDEAEVRDRIAQERAAVAERHTRAGRDSMKKRYGKGGGV